MFVKFHLPLLYYSKYLDTFGGNLKSKNMKKVLALLLIVGLGVTTVNAQDYKSAIGIKAGGGSLGTAGINFKTFTSSSTAMDLTLSFGSYGSGVSYYSFTALYELHQNAFDVDALNWYYGGGANVNYIDYKFTSTIVIQGNTITNTISGSNIGFGVLGVLGIEYTIPDIPVNIAIDIEPGLFYNKYRNTFNNNNLYFGIQGALAIRYIF